jgi:hypothetical protein
LVKSILRAVRDTAEIDGLRSLGVSKANRSCKSPDCEEQPTVPDWPTGGVGGSLWISRHE